MASQYNMQEEDRNGNIPDTEVLNREVIFVNQSPPPGFRMIAEEFDNNNNNNYNNNNGSNNDNPGTQVGSNVQMGRGSREEKGKEKMAEIRREDQQVTLVIIAHSSPLSGRTRHSWIPRPGNPVRGITITSPPLTCPQRTLYATGRQFHSQPVGPSAEPSVLMARSLMDKWNSNPFPIQDAPRSPEDEEIHVIDNVTTCLPRKRKAKEDSQKKKKK